MKKLILLFFFLTFSVHHLYAQFMQKKNIFTDVDGCQVNAYLVSGGGDLITYTLLEPSGSPIDCWVTDWVREIDDVLHITTCYALTLHAGDVHYGVTMGGQTIGLSFPLEVQLYWYFDTCP